MVCPLILGSTSTIRKQLLSQLQIPFTTYAPNIEERTVTADMPQALALKLSWLKATKVQEAFPDAVIIGADQVAIVQNQYLHKPLTLEQATKDLQSISGQNCTFYSAITVLAPLIKPLQHCDTTQVKVRELSLAEINCYLTKEQPLYCAGSFMVEGLGISLFEAIYSEDPTGLPGLPLIKLAAFLRQLGYQIP